MSSADVGDQLTEIHRPIRPEPIFWDTAACAGAPVLVGDTPVLAAGPVTGIDTDWTAPGWRTSRSTDTNPWNTAADSQPLADGGLGIGPAGELSVGGLEWLGARVDDPASRGFLSTDPYEPTTGAGWSANPYSYAGNDPLHASTPPASTRSPTPSSRPTGTPTASAAPSTPPGTPPPIGSATTGSTSPAVPPSSPAAP